MEKEELMKAVNLGKSILNIWQHGFPEDKSLHNALIETKKYANGVESLGDHGTIEQATEEVEKWLKNQQ